MAAHATGYLRRVIHNDFTFVLFIISIMLASDTVVSVT